MLAQQPTAIHGDAEITQPPEDGVSEIAFSPTAHYLAASSWDGKSRIWEVAQNGTSQLKAVIPHDAPALCVAWAPDGSSVVAAGCDKAARMMTLATGQVAQVAQHDGPIKCVRFVRSRSMNSSILVTAGWDKMLKYWDARSPNPIGQVQLPERAYAIDAVNDHFVVAGSNRKTFLFDINNPMTPLRTVDSPLKFQSRAVGMFKKKLGWALGSIEGRIGIQYADPSDSTGFSFKCHRDEKNIYSVNCIAVHPGFDTFATAGSDGTVVTWDKDSRQRLRSLGSARVPVTSLAWSFDGFFLAYAASYDWHKGYQGYQPGMRNTIFLHKSNSDETDPRPKGVKR